MNPDIEALLTFMPDATVIVDVDGRFAAANQAALDLFGYTLAEVAGQPVEMLVPERFRDLHRQQRAAYQAGPRARPMGAGLELFGRRKNGSEFPMDASLAPLVSGTDRLFIAAVRDTSDRRLSDQVLAKQVGHMTSAVTALSERIELPEQLNARQQRLDSAFKWMRRLAILMVVVVLVVILSTVNYIKTVDQSACQSTNESNATNAQFWRDIISKFPSQPPGPDATQSEKDAYARSRANLEKFMADVDALGSPKAC